MGTCVSKQTRPDGKPEEDREQPDVYSNSTPYFIAQLIALITHETYVISPNVTDTLLLTHIFYSDSITLLIAIRERFFITYERYKFTTYQRECDITITYNPSSKNKKDIHSNRPMKRLPIPNSPTPSNQMINDIITSNHQLQFSHSYTPSPSPDPQLENKNGFPNTLRMRDRSGTIDIGYIPTTKLDIIDWVINIKIIIQKKCLDLLLKWIENYWNEDFDNNDEIIDILTQFINDIKKSRDQFINFKYKKKKKNKAIHKIYASFIQTYILKLDNIIATQQTWYKPIMNELKLKQETATKLYNEQIQNSKRFRHNRLNSSHNNSHIRQSTNSVSAFSDNIFGDNLLERLYEIDNDSENDMMDEKSPQFSPKLTVQSIKPRKSYSKSKSITCSYDQQLYLSHDENNKIEMDMNTTLEFISQKNKENASEYAKQLTLLDWELFIAISPRNCLYKIIKGKKENEKYLNKWLSVKLFIDRFQQTHQYVIVSIIAAPNLKTRIEMIEFFIFVSDMLLQLNNLYSFMAVITALDSINICKLKISWEFVDKNLIKKFKNYLSPICNPRNNYKILRDYCKTMKPPGIPFLGLILKDLTFTNDGNKNRLSKQFDRQINFAKCILFHKILCENINKYKIKTYCAKIKHSKQFETQDLNAIIKELNMNNDIKEEEEDDDEDEININIIPDIELQEKIVKDLNSYILLNKNVIRAMTNEANRIDMLKKDEYVKEYLPNENNNNNILQRNSFSKSKSKSRKYTHFKSKSESEGNNNKKSKLSLKRFFGSKSNKKDENNINNMNTVKE